MKVDGHVDAVLDAIRRQGDREEDAERSKSRADDRRGDRGRAALRACSAEPSVWLGLAVPRSPATRRARARGVGGRARREARGAGATADAPATPIDWTAAETVEGEIARARDALAGLDFDAAERALARAEAALRDAPGAAAGGVASRGGAAGVVGRGGCATADEARAKRAWQRAAGLDGGREPGLGEKAFERGPGRSRRRFDSTGREGGAGLRLDGATIAPGEVTRTEGEHALAIVRARRARRCWAAWVSLAQGEEVRLEAPGEPRVLARGDGARAARGGEGSRGRGSLRDVGRGAGRRRAGSIRVATCEGSVRAARRVASDRGAGRRTTDRRRRRSHARMAGVGDVDTRGGRVAGRGRGRRGGGGVQIDAGAGDAVRERGARFARSERRCPRTSGPLESERKDVCASPPIDCRGRRASLRSIGVSTHLRPGVDRAELRSDSPSRSPRSFARTGKRRLRPAVVRGCDCERQSKKWRELPSSISKRSSREEQGEKASEPGERR